MAQDTFNQWHIAGLQAYKSASDQAIEGAQQAVDKATNPDFKQAATQVVTLMTAHNQTLVGFLEEAGAKVDATHDEILDGINRGTDLMLKAAEDDDTTDIALVTGGKVAINYFVTAFSNHVATANALGLTEQATEFQRMTDEQQRAYDKYDELAKTAIYPQAAQA